MLTGSIPPTGLPLPFISAGDTSLSVFMCAIGILCIVGNVRKMAKSLAKVNWILLCSKKKNKVDKILNAYNLYAFLFFLVLKSSFECEIILLQIYIGGYIWVFLNF